MIIDIAKKNINVDNIFILDEESVKADDIRLMSLKLITTS
jgi:hypothetical protein